MTVSQLQKVEQRPFFDHLNRMRSEDKYLSFNDTIYLVMRRLDWTDKRILELLRTTKDRHSAKGRHVRRRAVDEARPAFMKRSSKKPASVLSPA